MLFALLDKINRNIKPYQIRLKLGKFCKRSPTSPFIDTVERNWSSFFVWIFKSGGSPPKFSILSPVLFVIFLNRNPWEDRTTRSWLLGYGDWRSHHQGTNCILFSPILRFFEMIVVSSCLVQWGAISSSRKRRSGIFLLSRLLVVLLVKIILILVV